jgi:hypothetical protein
MTATHVRAVVAVADGSVARASVLVAGGTPVPVDPTRELYTLAGDAVELVPRGLGAELLITAATRETVLNLVARLGFQPSAALLVDLPADGVHRRSPLAASR